MLKKQFQVRENIPDKRVIIHDKEPLGLWDGSAYKPLEDCKGFPTVACKSGQMPSIRWPNHILTMCCVRLYKENWRCRGKKNNTHKSRYYYKYRLWITLMQNDLRVKRLSHFATKKTATLYFGEDIITD